MPPSGWEMPHHPDVFPHVRQFRLPQRQCSTRVPLVQRNARSNMFQRSGNQRPGPAARPTASCTHQPPSFLQVCLHIFKNPGVQTLLLISLCAVSMLGFCKVCIACSHVGPMLPAHFPCSSATNTLRGLRLIAFHKHLGMGCLCDLCLWVKSLATSFPLREGALRSLAEYLPISLPSFRSIALAKRPSFSL